MRCTIIAAGEGTRMSEITGGMNKCLLPVAGISVLGHIIRTVRTDFRGAMPIVVVARPRDVLAIESTFSDLLNGIVTDFPCSDTAGAANRGCLGRFDGPFLIWYGDVIAMLSPRWLQAWHAAHCEFHPGRPVVTLATYEVSDPWEKSLVIAAQDNRVLEFVEKPTANGPYRTPCQSFAGIAIIDGALLKELPDEPLDFGRTVFSRWIADGIPVYAHATAFPVYDTGTPEGYLRALDALGRS